MANGQQGKRNERQSGGRRDAETAKKAENNFYLKPNDEFAFLKAIETAHKAYHESANGGLRRERARAICAAVKLAHISAWTGTGTKLSTNSDALGVLAVSIAEYIQLKTWNNALADSFDDRLTAPDSAMSKKRVNLAEGKNIRFSGKRFAARNTDCCRETNITIDCSVEEPEFLFRFASVDSYSPDKAH